LRGFVHGGVLVKRDWAGKGAGAIINQINSLGSPSRFVVGSARIFSTERLLSDHENVVKFRPRLIVGAKGESIIAGLVTVSPAFVNFLREYLADNK
jgi:hypothetical protein